MKKFIFILLFVIIASLGYAGYRFFTQTKVETKATAYHKVTKADLKITLTESGVLKAVKETVIKNELSGDSKIVFIAEEGKRIKKGELLVELDSATAKNTLNKTAAEVETNQAAVITAENDLAIEKSSVASELQAAINEITFAELAHKKFTELNKNQQLRNAEIKITTAKEQYKLAQERYQWSIKLAEKGFETKNTVDRDKLDVNAKKQALEQAESTYEILKKFDLKKEEAQLLSNLKEAKSKKERVVKQGESKLAKSKAAVASAKRTLELSKERLDTTKTKLKQSKIFSPTDGLVLYAQTDRWSRQSKIEEGATVHQNRELISIPDISKMKVVVKVPEFHINRIKLGQKSLVTIESIAGKTFIGKVSRVAAVPQSNQSWLNDGEKFFKVEVAITDKLPFVKPSITGQAEIIIAELKNTLSAPIQAIHTEEGKHFCYVKALAGHEKREVTIGLMNNNFVELKKGINEGDEILLTAP